MHTQRFTLPLPARWHGGLEAVVPKPVRLLMDGPGALERLYFTSLDPELRVLHVRCADVSTPARTRRGDLHDLLAAPVSSRTLTMVGGIVLPEPLQMEIASFVEFGVIVECGSRLAAAAHGFRADGRLLALAQMVAPPAYGARPWGFVLRLESAGGAPAAHVA